MRSVDGIVFVELPLTESCCGFGGTFSVKNPEVSSAMLADEVRTIHSTVAEVCTSEVCTGGDASCLLHMGGGISRFERTGNFEGTPDMTAVDMKENDMTGVIGASEAGEELQAAVG